MTETERLVTQIIHTEFGVQTDDLDQLLSSVTRLGADRVSAIRLDSLDLVQFVVAVEEAFCLELDDNEAELINGSTVRQFCAFIDARLVAKAVLERVA